MCVPVGLFVGRRAVRDGENHAQMGVKVRQFPRSFLRCFVAAVGGGGVGCGGGCGRVVACGWVATVGRRYVP